MIAPFVVLLGLIALAPLLFMEWWLRHYPKVAVALGLITLVYYLGFLGGPATTTVLHTAHEYVSFIALIGSLFVVSGGIHITVKGEATPLATPSSWSSGRRHRQPPRHHRRFHAADPAVAAHEQIPRHRPSCGLLHLHRLQRGRLPDAHRRSAAVPGLSERHPLLVGGRALLAHVGGGRGLCCCSCSTSWTGATTCARPGTVREQETGSERSVAIRGPVQPGAFWR